MSHLDDVNNGITKLTDLKNEAIQVNTDLKKQIEYIPIVKGEKDEFGENTEKYITEISEKQIDKFIEKIDEVLNKKETMRSRAIKDDKPPEPQEPSDSSSREE